MISDHDTIAAISTAIGEAALSVIRLSGSLARQVAETVISPSVGWQKVVPRQLYRAQVKSSEGTTLDDGLMVFFQAPSSYTGEDLIEFHGHGGLLVTQKVYEAILHAGARAAGPGEFTQRAFLNSKMDLTQAEAVMDLIHAQSTLAMKAAQQQLSGAIGREALELKQTLLPVLAHVEAYIDFPEEDISPDTGTALMARMDEIIQRTHRLLDTAEQGRILRQGARTVICGEPNVGKSSLLNLLLGFERAIVSPLAGTTRDTLEEVIQVHGIPLRLVDTAGLRGDGADGIEQMGMERTRRELDRADLILEVVDASVPAHLARRVNLPADLESRRILLLNKMDLGRAVGWPADGVCLSCQNGEGVEALRDAIRKAFLEKGTLLGNHPLAINARHQRCFEKVGDRVLAAKHALEKGLAPEYIALDLREALQAIGEVVGMVDVEQVLDVIFSSFCIGK